MCAHFKYSLRNAIRLKRSGQRAKSIKWESEVSHKSNIYPEQWSPCVSLRGLHSSLHRLQQHSCDNDSISKTQTHIYTQTIHCIRGGEMAPEEQLMRTSLGSSTWKGFLAAVYLPSIKAFIHWHHMFCTCPKPKANSSLSVLTPVMPTFNCYLQRPKYKNRQRLTVYEHFVSNYTVETTVYCFHMSSFS